jgi:hypothetical protein
MAFHVQVGAMVPSTSTVPVPAIWLGSGTQSARASAMAGRIRSQRRETVAWLAPKISPARSWVRLVRISATTSATDRNRPIAAGLPPGSVTPPVMAATRAASSASCPAVSPVIASYRNGSSREFALSPLRYSWQEPFRRARGDT